MDNKGIANSLEVKLKSAEMAATQGKFSSAINVLRAAENEIAALRTKHVTAEAAMILTEDVNALIAAFPR